VPDQRLSCPAALELAVSLLVAYGASPPDAQVVGAHLVEAERAGLTSHGLMRVPQYIDEIVAGEIDPTAAPVADQVTATRVEIDGRWCFGQVAAALAVTNGVRLAAEQGMALVSVRHSGHAGRVGAYAERLGAEGFVSVIFCSGPRSGHRVAPFNGREGRLATNPIAFSIPTARQPIVGDFSTAAAPEGRIRWLRDQGLQAPPDTLINPGGVPTLDPGVLYTDPRGAIMPFGGERLGHRGFALGLLVEAMATLVAGEETSDNTRVGNNLCFVVISVDPEFRHRAGRMADYVLSAPPRGEVPVVLPGSIEYERRSATEIVVINEPTWQAMMDRASKVGLALNEVRA